MLPQENLSKRETLPHNFSLDQSQDSSWHEIGLLYMVMVFSNPR